MQKLNLKFNMVFTAMLVFSGIPVLAQMPNPLSTDPSVWNSREILLLWGQNDPENSLKVNQGIFGIDYIEYLQAGTSPFETRVAAQEIPASVFNPGVRPMAAQAADYDNDGIDEVLYAVATSGHIRISAPPIERIENPDSTFSIELGAPQTYLEVPTGVDAAFTPGRGLPLLVSGNFDTDAAAEFALAVRNSAGNIVVQIIDTDGGSTPHLRAMNQNESALNDGWNAEVFDICAGDFDGDGDDEIALICLKPSGSGSGLFSVFLRLYDIAGEGCATLVEKSSLMIDNQLIDPVFDDNNNLASVKVSVQAVEGATPESADRLIAGFAFAPSGENEQSNFFLRLFNISENLNTLTLADAVDAHVNFEHNHTFDLKCGDVNGDGHDNPVALIGNAFRVYSLSENEMELKAVVNQADYQSESEEYQSDNFEIADIDKNGRQNLLYAYTFMNSPGSGDRTLHVKSVELNPDYTNGTVITKQIMLAEDYSYSQFYFGLTAGNFDGDDLRLGTPLEYECYYNRPLFILAPPPIHFDHLNGEDYDLSGCFTESDCMFYASNTMEQSSVSTLSITDHSDWNVSGTVSAGFDGLYASVNASMTAKYGEQFSNESTSTNQQYISVQNTVTVDDFIKGVRYKVHVYEYPVYNAKGDLINYVSAAFPEYENLQEYQVQGKIDARYIPYYEPGNLLSYPPIGTATDFGSFSPGSLIYEGGVYTVSNNTGQSNIADISVGDVYGTTGSRSWEGGVATSLSASGFGLGFELNGEYNQGGLRVNSTQMSGSEGFQIRYDNIPGPSGYNAYSVKPYIFWTNDGAGMLAYQVDVASSNSAPTWWDQNYGAKADPALMLPQRNEVYYSPGADPGNPIFTRAKSMTFSRLYPNVGDDVTVQCRIHNYSLKATTGPVKVSFYNGNPDLGGELIADINGETVFETSDAIPARGRSVVEMTFYMPLPVVAGEDFVRFYAVIDPLNELDEIHENNNKGWQTIGYDCENQSGTSSVYTYYDTDKYREMWAWPNPASDRVSLAFFMAMPGNATLEIFDMQGKSQLHRPLGILPAGEQELQVNLPEMAPGIYFVRLKGKEFTKTRKLMIQ